MEASIYRFVRGSEAAIRQLRSSAAQLSTYRTAGAKVGLQHARAR
jgi:hypothetical protein